MLLLCCFSLQFVLSKLSLGGSDQHRARSDICKSLSFVSLCIILHFSNESAPCVIKTLLITSHASKLGMILYLVMSIRVSLFRVFPGDHESALAHRAMVTDLIHVSVCAKKLLIKIDNSINMCCGES